MLGAFSLTSLDATRVLFFNKTVKETTEHLRDVDFYRLVYDGEWTLDKFYELLKYAARDDGDAVMTVGTDDIFGLLSTTSGIRDLYFGAGQSYVNKTDNKTAQRNSPMHLIKPPLKLQIRSSKSTNSPAPLYQIKHRSRKK
jgi:hypothetical protein